MQRFLFPFLVVLLFLTYAIPAYSVTVTYTKTAPGGGTRAWNANWDPISGDCPCPIAGRTCKWETVSFNPSTNYQPTEVQGYGWLFTVEVDQLQFTSIDDYGNETGNSAWVNASGTTFLPNEWDVRIVSWPENPCYEGISVHLAGLTIANHGTITFFVPL